MGMYRQNTSSIHTVCFKKIVFITFIHVNCIHFIDYDSVNKLYHSAIVTEEYLQDTDKYWCEQCCRYNEAKRSVGYESLPRLLTLHLKRFCTNYR